MDSPDGVSSAQQIAIMSMLVTAEPEKLKTGFAEMIDGLIARAPSAIIDWASLEMIALRWIDRSDGEIYVQMKLGVNYLGEITPLEEDIDDA